jgi:hypothetical protein
MDDRPAGVSRTVIGLGSAISRLPSFLLGLLIIAVIGGGAFGAWWLHEKCGTQGVSACLFSSINPIPASYGRGVGKPLGCSPNEELDGALCYPKCASGFKGVGPVCWQQCPSGFRDDGTSCLKPDSYGRGAGYPWKGGDGLNDDGMFKRCEEAHGHGNCEKNGAIVYPKCKADFHNVGCCTCSPDCPSGMTDAGITCTKKTSGRTAGVVLHACPEGTEKDGALCYPLCKPGFKGVGPVCWESKG